MEAPPLQCTDVSALAERAKDPTKGFSVQDRSFGFFKYPKTFVGSEAVNWMFANVVGMRSRKEAIRTCQSLLDAGLFRPVAKRRLGKPFYDAYVLYRFTEDFTTECEDQEDGDNDLLGEKIKISSDQLDDILVSFRAGVEVKPRRWLFKTYPECFVGKEAVDWLCDAFNVSRTQAVELGQKMMGMGFFEHATDKDKTFLDADQYYCFVTVGGDSGPLITQSTTIYDFQAYDIDKKLVSFDDYRGKVLLVVNVASF